MANTLMFEVGIKSAQEQLDKIKQEFTKANGDLSKLLNIKVSIDGVDAVTKALSQIGDTSALRNLRNEIAALNREFSVLSKGAGGSGDIAGRGLAADIERTSQSIDRYTSKIKQLTEERSRLIGGTRNSSYQNFTDEIDRYEQSLEGARKKLAQLNEQKNQSVASEPLKKSTQDAQAFETALGRIETAIGSLKSGMSVNLTGDFSKWAQDVQNVTASVRELVEQLQKITTADGLKTVATSAQAAGDRLTYLKEELDAVQKKLATAEERTNKYYDAQFAAREQINKGIVGLKDDTYFTEYEIGRKKVQSITEEARVLINTLSQLKDVTSRTAFKDTILTTNASFLSDRKDAIKPIINDLKSYLDTLKSSPVKDDDIKARIQAAKELLEVYKAIDKAQTGFANAVSSGKLLHSTQLNELKKEKDEIQKEIQQLQKGTTQQGNIFDPQKFSTLQEAIDKIISEINRLQQAFTKLGENSSLSNLSTMINGLAVTLSTLSNAIKIQPLDEQVKALLERCEKAEAKLREVGDAAKYLNERAGAKTQQKASSIMGITGTDEEQLNKVSSTAERFMRLLVEIENQMTKIGKIQALGEQSGFSPTLLKNAQTQLEALKKMVESTIKGTPIAEGLVVPASASQLAQFIQQLGLLKAQYKDVITEADRFNKATEKGSSQAESRIRKLGMAFNDLKGYMKANGGSEEMKRLQSEIQGAIQKMRQLMNAGNFAGAVNVYERMAGSLRQAATATKEYERSVMGAASANSLLTSSEHQLANAIRNSSDNMKGQSQVLSDLKTMATQYLGVWGAQGFLRNVIEIGGQLEMQRLSIGAILGDMAKANELFDRIKNLAVKSPFGVVELDQMTKQLSAYGFEYNELFDMTKRLADISAATGTSVDRLALALGHVRSEAALSGYTLRQFSMANIPLAKKLSEELTKVEGKFVSVADVRKRVRTKDIGYEQVLKVLKDLTDEGGMFYNAQEIMSESVKARFKNLKDSMDIMYGEIAESSVGDALKDVASLLTTLTRHWQELGAVLVAGAGYWAINRIAMMAMSKAAVTNNIVTGQFTAKQLEAQAVTGNLTKQQLLRAVASRKMAVADAEAAANVLGLTTAQLQLVRRTGDVSRAMTMATVATSKYSIAQLRFMAMFRSFSLFNLKDLFLGIASGAKAAGVAVLGLVKSFWPMLALSAVAEVFMSMKREAESFADAANYVGQSARNLMKDIDETISSISKAGKPIDAEALRESVKTMKEVLEQSEYYTAEQQNQVDNAKTLSEKYDVLLKQLKEMREEAEWQTNNEGLIEKILSNTGKRVSTNVGKRLNRETGQYEAYESQSFGMSFFNDSLQENIDQVNKSNASLQSAINLLSEYQGVMDEAIRKNNSFGLSLEGKSWQEQIRIIAQSGHWEEFVASVDNAGSRFEKTADNVKKASEKVRDDWEEIVNDDVKAIRLTLMEEWGMTEDEINQFAKNNERTMRWLVDSIAKSLSKLGVAEQVIDEFKRKLLELFGVASSGKPVKRELTEYEKQTDLGKRVLANVIRHNKNNGKGGQGITTVKEINEIVGTGENVKTESEVVKALKERAQKDHEAMKDIGRIYGETSTQYAKAKKKYEHSLNLAESNNIKESDILTGKYKDKGSNKSEDDKYAKVLRERVRILKEAADSYQYWREKVGETGAERRMQGEFGQLLTEQNLQLKNSDELRAKLKALREEYSKKPQTKAMVEAIKEIDKEIANLDRKDFERDTEKFLSETQIKLDALTRAWDKFNTVREATGDIKLAFNISGVKYQEGERTLADAVRHSLEEDFKTFGVQPIEFNIELDKDSVKRQIQNAFAEVAPVMPKRGTGESDESFKQRIDAYNQALVTYEAHIKGVVTEYEKWQDLQKEVEKKDISIFLKALEDNYDREQQLSKVIAKYEDEKRSLDNLLRQWEYGIVDEKGNRKGITQEQYERAFANLTNRSNWNKFKAENDFNWVFDNISTTNLETLRKMVKAMGEYAKTTKMGAEETRAWQEAMDKLTDQENVLNPLKTIADTVTDYNTAVSKRKAAEDALRISQMSRVERKRNGIDESTVVPLQEALDDYKQALSNEERALLRVTKAINTFANKISELGSSLSSLGSTIGGEFGDIMNGVGGMLGDLGNTMKSASQLGEAMKTKGISGTVGKVSAVIGIIDSVVAFNQKLDSILPSTESIYEKYAEKQRKINELQEQIADYQLAALERQIQSTNWLYNEGLSELRNQGHVKENLLKEYANTMLRPQEIYQEARSGLSKWGPAIVGAIVGIVVGVCTYGLGSIGGVALGSAISAALGGTVTAVVGGALAAGAGAAVGTALRSAADQFMYDSNHISARENLRVMTQTGSFWRGEKTENLEDWVREKYGKELFDASNYDLIDIELAKSILESGINLAGETRATLERLVEYAEKIRELEDNVKEYVSQMFAPLVDNMTDALWDWLATGRDVIDSFEEYASDTFKNIAQDAVKSFLKINLIDKYQEKLNNIFTAYSLGAPIVDNNGNVVGTWDEQALGMAVASVAGEIRDSYEALAPSLEMLGETLRNAFDYQGYDIVNGGSGSSSSMSNTIKGVTEQTADLIASYISAIRLDVSVNRAAIAQYFPLFYQALTSHNSSLRNIENNTAAIMRSNETIASHVADLQSDIRGLKNKAWKMPIA